MARFERSGKRLDIFFDKEENYLDMAIMIFAVCAHPKDNKGIPSRQAQRYWEALYYFVNSNPHQFQPALKIEKYPSWRSAKNQLSKGKEKLETYFWFNSIFKRNFLSGEHLVGETNALPRYRLEKDFPKRIDSSFKPAFGRKYSSRQIAKVLFIYFSCAEDELHSPVDETTKAILNRHIRSFYHVIPMINQLSIVLMSTPHDKLNWDIELLRCADDWVPKAITESNRSASTVAGWFQLNRQQSVSPEQMIHFHLP